MQLIYRACKRARNFYRSFYRYSATLILHNVRSCANKMLSAAGKAQLQNLQKQLTCLLANFHLSTVVRVGLTSYSCRYM